MKVVKNQILMIVVAERDVIFVESSKHISILIKKE